MKKFNLKVNAAETENAVGKKHVCSITGEVYYGFGNNAHPYFGRCSDEANMEYVIPARICGIPQELIKRCGGNRAFKKIWDESETTEDLIITLQVRGIIAA